MLIFTTSYCFVFLCVCMHVFHSLFFFQISGTCRSLGLSSDLKSLSVITEMRSTEGRPEIHYMQVNGCLKPQIHKLPLSSQNCHCQHCASSGIKLYFLRSMQKFVPCMLKQHYWIPETLFITFTYHLSEAFSQCDSLEVVHFISLCVYCESNRFLTTIHTSWVTGTTLYVTAIIWTLLLFHPGCGRG